MAVTTDPFTATNLAAVIPEMWTTILLEENFAPRAFAAACMDLSDMATEGDQLHVPGVFTNTYTLQTQSTQGAEVTTESQTLDDITLAINTHRYVSTNIGDKDARQILSSFDINAALARKFRNMCFDGLEDALAALWSGLSTNSVGDTGTVLTDLELRQAVEKLDTGNFDLSMASWVLHPTVFWTQVAAISKIYDASIAGTSGAGVSGDFGPAAGIARGSVYGIPLYLSSNVVSGLQTYRNLLLHKEAFGYAIQTPGAQGDVRVQAQNRLANIATLAVVDIVYGVVEMRDAAGVVVNANTAATTA